jgi:hypothetical protein
MTAAARRLWSPWLDRQLAQMSRHNLEDEHLRPLPVNRAHAIDSCFTQPPHGRLYCVDASPAYPCFCMAMSMLFLVTTGRWVWFSEALEGEEVQQWW